MHHNYVMLPTLINNGQAHPEEIALNAFPHPMLPLIPECSPALEPPRHHLQVHKLDPEDHLFYSASFPDSCKTLQRVQLPPCCINTALLSCREGMELGWKLEQNSSLEDNTYHTV